MNPDIFNTGMRSNGTLINNRGFAKKLVGDPLDVYGTLLFPPRPTVYTG